MERDILCRSRPRRATINQSIHTTYSIHSRLSILLIHSILSVSTLHTGEGSYDMYPTAIQHAYSPDPRCTICVFDGIIPKSHVLHNMSLLPPPLPNDHYQDHYQPLPTTHFLPLYLPFPTTTVIITLTGHRPLPTLSFTPCQPAAVDTYNH